MKKLIEFIVSNIVDNPQKIKIEEEKEGSIIRINLNVAEEDMGKVIGKNGKIIKAIRNLAKIKAIKKGKKVFINLKEVSKV